MWLADGVGLGDADVVAVGEVVALGEVVDWLPPQLTSSRPMVTNTLPPRALTSLPTWPRAEKLSAWCVPSRKHFRTGSKKS
jgi:hypothetical protein